MEYKSISFVGFWSQIMSALSVLGVVALTFGPWAQPSAHTALTILIISSLVFGMISALATNVVALLEAQADQIAALQRQLVEPRSEA